PDAAAVQQHPLRRPRGAPRPGHRGPYRAVHRVLRATRGLTGRPGDPAGPRVPPPRADSRGRLARTVGRELPLRDVVRPPGTPGDRDGPRGADGRAGCPVARGPAEP